MRPLTAEWVARPQLLCRLHGARPVHGAQAHMHWERGLRFACAVMLLMPTLGAFGDDGKDPKQLAERFAERMRQAEGLLFEAIVSHERERDDGRLVPVRHWARRATVVMGKGTLHCRVFDGDRLLAVINCDGQNFVEWNCVVNQWTRYPRDAPWAGADLVLDEGVDACLVGSYLASWLPDPGESELPLQPRWDFERLRDGRHLGTERVEGCVCDVVGWPRDEEAVPRHRYYLSADGLLVQWKTWGKASIVTNRFLYRFWAPIVKWVTGEWPSTRGEAVAVRTRLYRNVSVSPVDPQTFCFTVPEGAAYVEPPACPNGQP